MADMQDLDSTEEIGEIEAVEAQQAEQAEAPKEEQSIVEQAFPPKYRGKSVEELVKMHQEAEKLISRQGAEVGEIRKLADELIKSQLAKPAKQEEPKEIDFFSDPQEAIRRAVESNPRVLAAEQYAVQARMVQAQQTVMAKHPDMGQIVSDPEFQEWVRSSKIRMKLFQEADQQYDPDAADELLSTFKALRPRPAARQDVRVDKDARDQMVRAASVEKGGSGESGKKIYRRADLIRLRIRDPGKYDAMQNEINAAYAEGRVK